MATNTPYTLDDFITEEIERDPVFAQVWAESAAERALHRAIVQARIDAGLTQSQLAEKMGVKQSVIGRIERDCSGIRLSTIQRIVNATGRTITLNVEPIIQTQPVVKRKAS